MALVDDDVAIALDQGIDLALPRQGLHHGNINPAAGPVLAAADGADRVIPEGQKSLQTLPPLLHQRGAVYQHQGIHAPSCDKRGRCHGFTKCRRGAEHPDLVFQQGGNRGLLIGTQHTGEPRIQPITAEPLVTQIAGDAVIPKQGPGRIQTAARQGNVPRKVFGTAYHPWLVPDRHPHGLRPVESGILKGSEPDQPVGE